MVLAFGKHAGKDIRDVEEDYLLWLIESKEKDLKVFKDEIERRKMVAEGKLSLAARIVQLGYRELSKKAHPDTGGSSAEFQALQAAKAQLDMILGEAQKLGIGAENGGQNATDSKTPW